VTAHLTDQPGVRFGLANGLLVAAFVVAGVARLTSTSTGVLAVAVAGLAGIGLTVAMTVWLGVIAWALFTGFVENAYGQLSFGHGDLVRLLVFPLLVLALAALVPRPRPEAR
jgi:hypothetical protein